MIIETNILCAISETMTCAKCPYPCKSKEKSSRANCVKHWSEILLLIDKTTDWNEVRYRVAERLT